MMEKINELNELKLELGEELDDLPNGEVRNSNV